MGTGSSIPTDGSDLYLGFNGDNGTAVQEDPDPNHAAVQPLGSQYYGIATLNSGTALEVAVAWSYFNNDPYSLGFTPTTPTSPDIQLRLSQTFSYSVNGGIANYGANDLGVLVQGPAPPPGTPEIDAQSAVVPLALGLGMLLLASDRRRRKAKAL